MPFPVGFLIGLACASLATVLLPRGRQRLAHAGRDGEVEPRRVGFGLWVGLAAGSVVLGLVQGRLDAAGLRGVGSPVWTLPLAALPLALATLASDLGRVRSERHAVGLLVSGVALFFAGFAFPVLTNPLTGTVAVATIWQVILCAIWLFLLASVLEMISLIPAGVGLFGLALSGVIWLAGGTQQTVASYALAGLVAGAIAGRMAAGLVAHRGEGVVPLGKTEVFGLALWLTALTNAAFLKSVALAGFVLPLGALAVMLIVLTLRAFERSLLLRPAPRSD
ncbi:MAG: hypothetical protein RLY93_06250 [Sumerlaeia bacterium]